MPSNHPAQLSCDQFRWRCDPDSLDFETTDDVAPAPTVVGQEAAFDALSFGIECDAPGQNVYVRGSRGTGRTRMVEKRLEEMRPVTDSKRDCC